MVKLRLVSRIRHSASRLRRAGAAPFALLAEPSASARARARELQRDCAEALA